MANKAKISKKDERLLHTKSGNRCAICKVVLVDAQNPTAACIGENAHIYGEKPSAARYDSTKSAAFVNSEQNLIFLCCNCHKKIDTDAKSYTVKNLLDLKSKHELWVIQELGKQSISYGFSELEVLAKYIMASAHSSSSKVSYSLLKIDKKIDRNSLLEVQGYITMGLSSNKTIEEFLNKNIYPFFASDLTNIMASKYQELKNQGLGNIEIFDELWNFTSGNSNDFSYRSAGLGILTYFFEKCEIFEK